MGKSIRAGIVVEVVVLVVAVSLSIAYFQLGLFEGDDGFNVWLIILWILVAAIFLFILWQRSVTREEIVRRFYVSDEGVYNHEIGYAPFSRISPDTDAYEFVSFAADSLADMSYGFEVVDPPDDFTPLVIISTRVLLFHKPDDEEDGGAVIDQWKGTLQKVGTPGDESTYKVVGSYANARELARLLEENGIFL